MKQPCVSIVIPTYNCLAFLPDALRCISKQNITHYEILIADDGSTDGTWEWLKQQQSIEPRIHPIKLKGVGPSKARNLCIEKAKGEFIAFLDADDIWYDNKLSPQIDFMKDNPYVVLTFTDFKHININGENLGGCFQFWSQFNSIAINNNQGYHLLPNALSVIYQENVIGTSSVVVRKDSLIKVKGFDETLSSAEDWDLWLKLSQQGELAFTNKITMDYLMRANSESSKANQRLQAIKTIMERYESQAIAQNKSTIRLSKARYLTAQAELYRSQGIVLKALYNHFKALLMKPDKRALKAFLSDGKRLVIKA